MQRDGTGQRKALPDPVLDVDQISPDRRYMLVNATVPRGPELTDPPVLAIPLDGGPARMICDHDCDAAWSPDGRYLYMDIAPGSRANPNGKTAAIPIPPGQSLPPLPPAAVHDFAEWAKVPGVKIVEHDRISPGPNPSIYAYINNPPSHANLFRIPLR